jgi:hypothetical protein
MAERVDLYLDVDGVINAFRYNLSTETWPWPTDPRTEWINGYRITWSPELVERLNALCRRPGVKVHWLTTWQREAAEVLSPQIGLDGEWWPVPTSEIDKDRMWDMAVWWKFDFVRTLDPATVPIVWVDDELVFDKVSASWAAEYPEDTLLISPAPHKGITPNMLEKIEEFIDRHLDTKAA